MATASSNQVNPLVNSSNGSLQDEFIAGLVQGGKWLFSGPQQLTYSFNLNDNGAGGPGPGGAWTTPLTQAVQQALAAWSSVANISFQQITSGTYYYQSTADLAFTLTGDELQTQLGAVGLGVFPSPEFADLIFDSEAYPNAEGDVFLDNFSPLFSALQPGSGGFWVILHEIGHALGLKHPSDDGDNSRPLFSSLGLTAYDTMSYTLMTTNGHGDYAASPLLVDILAIQALYGANNNYRTGDDIYVISDHFADAGNTHYLDLGSNYAIWDAGGIDTLTIDWADGFYIDLKAGRFSDFEDEGQPYLNRIAIAYDVDIENAIGGSGHDWIFANDLHNRIEGGSGDGDDYIEARAGNDTILGGGGGDYGDGEEGIDWLFGGEGGDLLRGGSSGDFLYGENGNDFLDAEDGDDRLFGGAGVDHLHGGPGSDTLDGGFGADSLVGDIGSDYYFNVGPDDLIYEGQEYFIEDWIVTDISLSIPSLVEGLILDGSGDYWGSGNELDNKILGNTGRNVLNGNLGRDTLYGGAGDDVYILDDSAPVSYLDINRNDGAQALRGLAPTHVALTNFNPDPAPDRLRIDFSAPYSAYSYLVHLSLDDLPLVEGGGSYSSTPQAIAGFNFNIDPVPFIFDPVTNPQSDFLGVSGTYQINNLSLGGSGWSLTLLAADISFEFDSMGYSWSGRILFNTASDVAWDVVSELADEGNDIVYSAYGHALADNVENLVLTGVRDSHGVGNGSANVIAGNSGHNILDGAAGADIIAGGPGNDTYIVDHANDQVMELGSSGTDSVQSSVTYSLMQAWHVEHLTLTGAGAIHGSGNWLDNVIQGNAAANQIDGNRGNDTIDGGGGADMLIGGLGDDVLVWDALDVSVQGGAGMDTLLINGGGVTLNLFTLSDSRITDIEVINLTGSGNNTLTLGLADVLALSSTTDQLRVDGDAGDALNLQGVWSNTGSAGGYVTYGQGSATLQVDADITVGFV